MDAEQVKRATDKAAQILLQMLAGMSNGLNYGMNSNNKLQIMLVNLNILQKVDLQLLSLVLSLIRISYF